MRSQPPPLLPVFRSRHQADLLTLLSLHPAQEYTVTELAGRLGVPLTTLHREVQRLIEAELLQTRTVGRSRLVRANIGHRAFGPLAQLVLVTFGPHTVVEDEFAGLAGVNLVLIFGSWAARYEGQPGPPPNDLDVLVVGRPERAGVYEAAERAEQRLRFPVNPTIRSRQRWESGDDPLVRQIKSAPRVPVIDNTTRTERKTATVSLPQELAVAAQAAASADELSLSGWLARAVEQQLRLHERGRLLQEWQVEHGSFSPQEIAAINAEMLRPSPS